MGNNVLNEIKSLNERMNLKLSYDESLMFNEKVLMEGSANGSYYDVSDDELMEYVRLRPDVTGIGVDLWIDDGFAYDRWGHEIWLLFRNGYTRDIFELVALNVEGKPRICNGVKKINISHVDLDKILKFIATNRKALVDIANDRIYSRKFIRSLQENINEVENTSSTMLNEMARLTKDITDLPVDLWLEDDTRTLRHCRRIKFQSYQGGKKSSDFSSLVLDNPLRFENLPKKCFLKQKQLDMIMEFVTENIDLLKMYFEQTITFEEFQTMVEDRTMRKKHEKRNNNNKNIEKI